ncbi:hypothetical protein [Anaeromyxobacter oryzisoli]|uniref:hypothetical protein n=1 Tax=Anaeromyxobacter oryzisoli TaxID=2925408 RepID=UPI001F562FC4|nr:hypothetical protein [Anaeromyxobacter sp. SG63]
MRRIAASLVLLLPLAGSAFEWTGQLGFVYDRTDSWQDRLAHDVRPHYDLDLRLDTKGYIDSPGVFDWRAAGGYRRSSVELNGAKSQLSDTFIYNVHGALFQHADSPLTLTGFASRTDTRFGAVGGMDAPGNRTTDRYGGVLHLASETTPEVDLGYQRNSFKDEFPAQPDHTRTSDVFSALLHQDVGAFAMSANYRRENSDGTWISDQFDEDTLYLNAQAHLGKASDVTVYDQYYRRTATAISASAFSLDLNTFQAGYRAGIQPGELTLIRYLNSRAFSDFGAVSTEVLSNSLSYSQDFATSNREVFIRGGAELTTRDTRGPLGNAQSRGATLRPEAWWRRSDRRRTYELSAGPLLGALQSEGSTRFGYGAMTRARVEAPWNDYTVGAMYELTYDTNLFGRHGWALSQQGSGSVRGAAGPGRFAVQLSALARRGWTDGLGDEATRSLSARGEYSWHRYTARGQLDFQSGILPGTPQSFIGDGLLVPVGFSTHSTTAIAGMDIRLLTSLSATGQLRYTLSTVPGQPDQDLLETLAAVAYRYGAFELSIEDRLSRSNAASATNNIVLVRVARTIGSRY